MTLPACQHRAPSTAAGKVRCHSDRVVLKLVPERDCLRCPYADRPNLGTGKARQPAARPPELKAADFPCVHRGEQIATEECELCGRKGEMFAVHACALHGRCSIGTRSKHLEACVACDDRQEPAKPVVAAPIVAGRPVRVGWILPHISFGGVCRGVMTLLERCLPAEVEHTGIAIANLKPLHESLARRMARFTTIYAPTGPGDLPSGMTSVDSFVAACQRIIDASDVLQLWGLGPQTAKQLAGLDWRGKPVVLRSHGACDWTRKMFAGLLPYATHYMAVSQAAVTPFPETIRPQVMIVENGVDQERCAPMIGRQALRRAWGIAADEIVIGYHGRFSAAKRPESAARAAARLGRPYRSVFVGATWTSAKGRKLVESLDPNAICVETLDHVGDFLAAIDVAILNSQSEGMSQSLLEYWMAGVPVVATEVGAVVELEARHGPLIVRIPYTTDAETLADAVRQACAAEHQAVVDNARRMAREHFTAARMAQRFTAHVQAVAGRVRPVRVGLLTHGLWRGGAELWMAQLARQLHNAEVGVSSVGIVGTTGVDEAIARSIAAAVPLYGRAATEPPRHGRTYDVRQMAEVLPTAAAVIDRVARDADVLLTWSPTVARQAAGGARPVVFCSQTSIEEPRPKPLPNSLHLVAVSRQAERYFAGRGVDHVPRRIIPSGIAPERVAPRHGRTAQRAAWGAADGEIVVGFLGRQSPEKGFLALAAAVPYLPPHFRAVYYGQDQQQAGATHPELLRLAERHGDGRVQFFPPADEVGDLYAGLDVLVSSSLREAFSLVVAEAWLAGVPVVSTRLGIVQEARDNRGPLAIEIPTDPAPWDTARAIVRAAGDEGRATAERARQYAAQHLTADVMLRRWTDYLCQLVRS